MPKQAKPTSTAVPCYRHTLLQLRQIKSATGRTITRIIADLVEAEHRTVTRP